MRAGSGSSITSVEPPVVAQQTGARARRPRADPGLGRRRPGPGARTCSTRPSRRRAGRPLDVRAARRRGRHRQDPPPERGGRRWPTQPGCAVLTGRAPIATPAPFSLVSRRAAVVAARPSRPTDPMPPVRPRPRAGAAGVAGRVAARRPRRRASAGCSPLEGVVHLLRAIVADAGGAVLLVDDLHAADAESLEAVRYIAAARDRGSHRRRRAAPVRVAPTPTSSCACLRRDGSPRSSRSRRSTSGPWATSSPRSSSTNPPSPLVADVLARTDGVPLLVEELVRGHVRRGHGRRWTTAAATWRGGAAQVPGTIRDLVDARLAPLDAPERDRSSSPARWSATSSRTVMRAVTGPTTRTIAGGHRGRRAGRPARDRPAAPTAFRHAIIREAVLDATVPHVVDTLHRRAANALERRTAIDAEALERRARHLAAVGAHDEAATALTSAADRLCSTTTRCSRPSAPRAAGEATRRIARGPRRGGRRARRVARRAGPVVRGARARRGHRGRARRHAGPPAPAGHVRARRRAARRRRRRPRRSPARPETTRPELRARRRAGPRSSAATARRRSPARERVLGSERRGDRRPARGARPRGPRLRLPRRPRGGAGRRGRGRHATRRRPDAPRRSCGPSCSSARSSCSPASRPHRLYEARRAGPGRGSLVELAWAEENLAIALAIAGDLAAAGGRPRRRDRAVPPAPARPARLPPGGPRPCCAATRVEDVEDDLAEAEAVVPTPGPAAAHRRPCGATSRCGAVGGTTPSAGSSGASSSTRDARRRPDGRHRAGCRSCSPCWDGRTRRSARSRRPRRSRTSPASTPGRSSWPRRRRCWPATPTGVDAAIAAAPAAMPPTSP